MKKILVLVAFFGFTIVANAQSWQDVTLMDKVTVSLPGQPKVDNSKGVPMQKVVLEDSSEVYAGTIDLSVFGMTEDVLKQVAATDDFKDQIEASVGMQPGLKVVKIERGMTADSHVFYDLVMDVDKDGVKGIIYNRQVIYKTFTITLGYKPGKKGENTSVKEKFFNSVKIAG